MAKKATNDELLAQFDDLDVPRTGPAASERPADESDPLAGLEQDLAPRSRPHTPRVGTASPRKSADVPRKMDGPRKSAEVRKSMEVRKSTDEPAGDTEKQGERNEEKPEASGGWWGALSGVASAAVKQAEALAKDIQQNEDAQRWAEQVRGNVGMLRSYGGELRSKALPTFTSLLHTLAPPISAHERLQIHITHDLTGYPSLDPLIYQTFARVMAQVEGGDLLVIQRGQEAAPRRGSDVGYMGSGASGWDDGPWWKQTEPRDLGSVQGLVEGTKLARASAEAYAHEFFGPRGGVEEAAKQATATLSESNPTRKSDIFLALQAIVHDARDDLFGESPKEASGVAEPAEKEELVTFAIYLHDPIHGISFAGLTQSLPAKWTAWVDNLVEGTPEEIEAIVREGGLDPREWVAEWLEEVLNLGVGVVAQKYVARRMGVGEGGLKRGKAKEVPVDAGAGELARAL